MNNNTSTFPYITETFEEISLFKEYVRMLRLNKKNTLFPVPSSSYFRYFLEDMLRQAKIGESVYVKVNDLTNDVWGSFSPNDLELWFHGVDVKVIVAKDYEELECKDFARWLLNRGSLRKSVCEIDDEHVVIGEEIFVAANNEKIEDGCLGCVHCLDSSHRENYVKTLIETDEKQWNNVKEKKIVNA